MENKIEDVRSTAKLTGFKIRSVFGWIFVILSLLLMSFPLVMTFNDMLTRLVISLRSYRILAEYVVPTEVNWVVVILKWFGVQAYSASEYVIVQKEGEHIAFEIIWNCIGWQSLIMFLVTLLVGFQQRFSWLSKVKTIALGLVGTIFVNIFRIVVVILMFLVFGRVVGLVVHDYAGLLTNTIWFITYWWFSYAFILE